MYKIYPAENKSCTDDLTMLREKVVDQEAALRPSMLTVWKRSSMSFQGTDGFTVFDQRGRLVFRVDNYSRNNRCVTAAGLVLMDGAGNALLSLKPQILSMQYQWKAYREEEEEGCACGKSTPRSRSRSRSRSRVFSMRSSSVLTFFHSGGKDNIEAEVYMGGKQGQGQSQTPDFRVEGCFRSRNCKITTATGELVAKIARKRVNSTILLSDDVFSLVVQPGFPSDLVMAFVVILDRISSKPFTPVLCS